MAEIRFEFDREQFLRLVAFLKEKGFYFVNGMLQKDKSDITRDYDFLTDKDYPYRNGQFYLFPKFSPHEKMEIKSVDNIHMGRIFAVECARGGPYLELLFNMAKDEDIFVGDVCLRPKFFLKDYSIVKPDDSLKAVFGDIRSFIRREMRGKKASRKSARNA